MERETEKCCCRSGTVRPRSFRRDVRPLIPGSNYACPGVLSCLVLRSFGPEGFCNREFGHR